MPDIAALKILKSYDGEPVFEEPTTKPTARMLFTHTAGFCYDWESPAIAKYRVEKKLGNLLWDTENNVPRHAITGVPLHFNPGDRFVYGTSSDWLGFVVEAISGMDLDAYFRENIFKPLNIHDSSFYELPGYEAKHTNVVRHTGTYTSDNERVDDYKPDQPWLTPRPQTCLGGAGLRGSPRSYLRVLQALLRKGELDGARILKPESVELFFSPHIERDDVLDDLAKFLRYNNDPYSRAKESGWVEGESSVDSLKNWGLGGALYLEALESGRSSGSMAWSGVAQTHWVVDPKSDVCFIVWSNTLSTPCWDPVRLCAVPHPRTLTTGCRICTQCGASLRRSCTRASTMSGPRDCNRAIETSMSLHGARLEAPQSAEGSSWWIA